MKRFGALIAVIMLASLVLVACVATQPKKVGDYLVYENKKVQFKQLSGEWQKTDPGGAQEFGNFCVLRNKKNPARIWVRARDVKKGTSISKEELSKGANGWINAMAKKYKYKDFERVSDGWTNINGEESYWSEYKFNIGKKDYHEKIYRVYLNQYIYQFRLISSEEAYNGLIPEFEEWVKTIKFIR